MSEKKTGSSWSLSGREITTNVVAGVITAIVLAVGAWLIAPVRNWLLSPAYLYGWVFVAIVLSALGLGLLVGGQILRRSRAALAAHSPAPGPAVSFGPMRFEPNDLERRAIRLLRIADGKWASFDLMVEQLAVGSRQDLAQSLTRMMEAGWVEGANDNIYKKEGARSYRLDDRGITYAREQGFETYTEIQRGAKAPPSKMAD